MPDQPRMIYWDSCIFLHYIEATPTWVPILDAIVEDAIQDGDYILVTSTVSIVEVNFAEAEREGSLKPEIDEAIRALWTDRSTIKLVDLDQTIAGVAHDLVRRSLTESRSLKPMDAIHLATAMLMQAVDFHTTDKQLHRWNDLGFPVRDPWTSRPRLGI